jgi:hypothetical protein
VFEALCRYKGKGFAAGLRYDQAEAAMGRETKIVRAIRDAVGTISYDEGLYIAVHFDLLETQESVDGVPSASFGMGNIRYEAKSKQIVSTLMRSPTRLVLQGGGIQAASFLHRTNEFTVMNLITPSTQI